MSTASVVRWTCDAEGCGEVVEVIDEGIRPYGWLWLDVRTPQADSPRLVDCANLTLCPAHGTEVRAALRKQGAAPDQAGSADADDARSPLRARIAELEQRLAKLRAKPPTLVANVKFKIGGKSYDKKLILRPGVFIKAGTTTVQCADAPNDEEPL